MNTVRILRWHLARDTEALCCQRHCFRLTSLVVCSLHRQLRATSAWTIAGLSWSTEERCLFARKDSLSLPKFAHLLAFYGDYVTLLSTDGQTPQPLMLRGDLPRTAALPKAAPDRSLVNVSHPPRLTSKPFLFVVLEKVPWEREPPAETISKYDGITVIIATGAIHPSIRSRSENELLRRRLWAILLRWSPQISVRFIQ